MPGLLLGLDIGTSSVKAALVDAHSGQTVARASSPATGEIPLRSPHPGWAEQDPEDWWNHTVEAINQLKQAQDLAQVQAIGVAYQMHGLVLLDQNHQPVRPAIIWCDSRAVESGDHLATVIGPDTIARNLLNPPGNFTASKLAWVAEHEPETLARAAYAMLPGDYIAARLTGQVATSQTGLSEMTLWDFEQNSFAEKLFAHTGAPRSLFPTVLPTLSNQTKTNDTLAHLGLSPGIPVTYRAGDQPNNALSLGVLNPGEAATTAGTSGVVYAVTDRDAFDPQGRVNTFLHVNHTPESPRRGVLLCLNGCGSLYSWLRRTILPEGSFQQLNDLAAQAPAGSEGLLVLPFGNGAERTLNNQNPGAAVHNLDFNRHTAAHLARAAQEGIIYALADGMEAMTQIGCPVTTVKAGRANLFLSDLFCQSFADITGCTLTLHDTDGSVGAALGAGLAQNSLTSEVFQTVPATLAEFQPSAENQAALTSAFTAWKLKQTQTLKTQ